VLWYREFKSVVAMQSKFHMDFGKELLMKMSKVRCCKLFSEAGCI
jgi:hypothetical protein